MSEASIESAALPCCKLVIHGLGISECCFVFDHSHSTSLPLMANMEELRVIYIMLIGKIFLLRHFGACSQVKIPKDTSNHSIQTCRHGSFSSNVFGLKLLQSSQNADTCLFLVSPSFDHRKVCDRVVVEGGGGGGVGEGGRGTRLADVLSSVQMTQTWRHMFVSFPGSPTRCFMFQWENFFRTHSNPITLITMETEYTARV